MLAARNRYLKNNLPVGSTREQVNAFLNQRIIQHNAVGEMPPYTHGTDSGPHIPGQ
jgi:hypothetical protein